MSNEPTDANLEPVEVRLIAAASDGFVNVTPEKCELVRKLMEAEVRLTVAGAYLAVRDVIKNAPCHEFDCGCWWERIPSLTPADAQAALEAERERVWKQAREASAQRLFDLAKSYRDRGIELRHPDVILSTAAQEIRALKYPEDK